MPLHWAAEAEGGLNEDMWCTFLLFLIEQKKEEKSNQKSILRHDLPNRSSIAGQICSFYRTAVIAFLFVAFQFAGIVNLPVAGL